MKSVLKERKIINNIHMPIPTSRTKENAKISIDYNKCTACGLCVSVCKDFSLRIVGEKLKVSNSPLFGCMACGHCMAICPHGAIQVKGRFMSPEDVLPLMKSTLNYTDLYDLLIARRSVREFREKEVSGEMLNMILDAARTSPMGLPPSDVHVLVVQGKEKVGAFAADFSTMLGKMKYLSSNLMLSIMRPFWGKENDELFRAFIKPLFKVYTDGFSPENNHITYDAPLMLYFYATPYSDPADPLIAATYAMLAAESLGLGSCMLGGIHPFIQRGRAAAEFRRSHKIKYKSKEGLFLVIGHPAVKYSKGIKRSFAAVDYL